MQTKDVRAKTWQNKNRIWSLQMRKCQRLVEWNLLGHPTVTSGKRQEVSSLGRSHSELASDVTYYILITNRPMLPLMSDPSHPSRNIADTSPSGSVCTTFRANHDSELPLRNPIVSHPPIHPQVHGSCPAEWRPASSARSSRVCEVLAASDMTLHSTALRLPCPPKNLDGSHRGSTQARSPPSSSLRARRRWPSWTSSP